MSPLNPSAIKNTVNKESQEDIQFVATGVKFFDNKKQHLIGEFPCSLSEKNNQKNNYCLTVNN